MSKFPIMIDMEGVLLNFSGNGISQYFTWHLTDQQYNYRHAYFRIITRNRKDYYTTLSFKRMLENSSKEDPVNTTLKFDDMSKTVGIYEGGKNSVTVSDCGHIFRFNFAYTNINIANEINEYIEKKIKDHYLDRMYCSRLKKMWYYFYDKFHRDAWGEWNLRWISGE